MNAVLVFALAGLASYLIGAVPFAYLLARAKGVDIRAIGSGNVGATNVFRAVSRPLGILTFLLDVGKGFGPAFLLPRLAPGDLPDRATLSLGLLCACMAVIGHTWPVYLRFRGGKGVATTSGALLALVPAAAGIAFAAWAIVFAGSRYVSAASLAAAAATSASSWFLYLETRGPLLPSALTAIAILVMARHTGNIRRLLRGTENRFEFGHRKPTP